MAKYDNKLEAVAAAKKVAWDKLGEGCTLTRYDYNECIHLVVTPAGTGMADTYTFHFDTVDDEV